MLTVGGIFTISPPRGERERVKLDKRQNYAPPLVKMEDKKTWKTYNSRRRHNWHWGRRKRLVCQPSMYWVHLPESPRTGPFLSFSTATRLTAHVGLQSFASTKVQFLATRRVLGESVVTDSELTAAISICSLSFPHVMTSAWWVGGYR